MIWVKFVLLFIISRR